MLAEVPGQMVDFFNIMKLSPPNSANPAPTPSGTIWYYKGRNQRRSCSPPSHLTLRLTFYMFMIYTTSMQLSWRPFSYFWSFASGISPPLTWNRFSCSAVQDPRCWIYCLIMPHILAVEDRPCTFTLLLCLKHGLVGPRDTFSSSRKSTSVDLSPHEISGVSSCCWYTAHVLYVYIHL